ncbi:predicted protein [Ostreococcus lucimarinus CCE9901]|uniref:Uncharacterized protein n=1 Tax=Ostreococcus lucimarinus (strain CCE9901) TaxID=436017 RepID=A4RVZ7_OSTLU|nr:predicted protein [Ostreococcus lucimarinus CCE9901]ABO95789.1 predicted protein [Ostreococcus lucimarinus CCE9901]|eukprot:XP_001417496.1 predicted protein [Ostreococcus lucimarinus CCE9901]
MREGVDALERRARALREELESRDGMLEAVQTQAKMDVESARRERDEARREAKAEKTMRMEAAAMALTALEAKARSEAAMEARDEATPREVEMRRELEDAEARLKRAEEAVRARGAGDGDVALTPGRSPSAASFAKKVALVEARVRGDVERRRDELLRFLRRERKGGNARGRGGGGGGGGDGGADEVDVERARGAATPTTSDTASDDGDASLGTDARGAAVEWGVAQSEAYSTVVELMKRVMMVLERASELASVDDAAMSTDEDDVETKRSWSAAAADLRDPDPTLEQLVRWLEAVELVDDEEHAVTLRELMARMCALTHAVVFSLKRAVSAAAEAREETSEAYAIAEEAAEVYRLHLAQAESRATMAERRAVAAEEATETITELSKPAVDAPTVDADATSGKSSSEAKAPESAAAAKGAKGAAASDFQEVSLSPKAGGGGKRGKGGDAPGTPIAKPSKVDDAMVKEMEAAVESVAKPTAKGVKTIPKPKPATEGNGGDNGDGGAEKSKSQRKNERKRERAKQKKLEDKARIASASMKNSVNTERDLY